MAEQDKLSPKEEEIFEGFAVEDVESFESNPFWQALMVFIQDRIGTHINIIVADNIKDRDDFHTSNASLRGGLIELGYVTGYPGRIKTIIKELEETKKLEEEFSDGE